MSKKWPSSGPEIIGPSRTNGPLPNRKRRPRSSRPRCESWGERPYLVEGYLTRPDESIAKLGPIDDPLIGLYVHWTYAPHTVDGVVGKDNPLLLASNFSGTWPGPGGASQHRRVARERRPAGLADLVRRPDWTADARFMERLDEWCTTGRIGYDIERAALRRGDPPGGDRRRQRSRRRASAAAALSRSCSATPRWA